MALKLKSKKELMRLVRKSRKSNKTSKKRGSRKTPAVSKLAKELIRPPVLRRRKVVRKPQLQQPQTMLNLDTSAVYRRYLVEKHKALLRKKMQEMELSQSTQQQLARLATIQNKSKTDDYKRQRIKREREVMGKSTSILNTPYIFKGETIDVSQIKEDNILLAPNTFKEREDNPNILKQQRLSILQTREAGNQLNLL